MERSDLGFELKAPVAGQALTVMVPAARLRSVRVDGASAAYTTEWLMGRGYALVTTAAARARFVASYDASRSTVN